MPAGAAAFVLGWIFCTVNAFSEVVNLHYLPQEVFTQDTYKDIRFPEGGANGSSLKFVFLWKFDKAWAIKLAALSCSLVFVGKLKGIS